MNEQPGKMNVKVCSLTEPLRNDMETPQQHRTRLFNATTNKERMQLLFNWGEVSGQHIIGLFENMSEDEVKQKQELKSKIFKD